MFEPGGVVGIGNTGHAKQLEARVPSVPPEQGAEIARRTSLICLTLSFCSFWPEPSPRAASARSVSNSQQACICSYVAHCTHASWSLGVRASYNTPSTQAPGDFVGDLPLLDRVLDDKALDKDLLLLPEPMYAVVRLRLRGVVPGEIQAVAPSAG